MIQATKKYLGFFLSGFIFLFFCFFASHNIALAQSKENHPTKQSKDSTDFTQQKLAPLLTTGLKERLEELQQVISEKRNELNRLKKDFTKQGERPELDKEIAEVTQELETAKKGFEEIVIGEVSLDIFEEDNESLTWQEELTIVVKPLLENLRNITEKPRQRETIKTTIDEQDDIIKAVQTALNAIEHANQDEHSETVTQELKKIKNKWLEFEKESKRKKELATLSLAKLNGKDEGWLVKLKLSLQEFAQERGLTLVIALLVVSLIIIFFKALTKLLEYHRKKNPRNTKRTAYRVLIYAQRLVMVAVILTSVLVVFFIRGDVLLLALMLVVIFAVIMGLKSFLPQFIEESRLLLNIGPVREQELVNYQGIPWRIASINVFSLLINPEIRGVLRLPLSSLKELTSRQINEEQWFPSSIGDWILDDTNRIYEVINQTPDAVELQSSQGTNKLIPTAQYYAAGLVNLTKSKNMRITITFGLDYALQAIALDIVPTKLQAGIQTYLESLDLGTKDISSRVELQTANSSSLDYLVIVLIDSSASRHYYRIERAIQQACVKVCNEENWGIPFPQLTISKEES